MCLAVPDAIRVHIVLSVIDPLVGQHSAEHVGSAGRVQIVPLVGEGALQPAGLQVAVLVEEVPVTVDLLPVVGGIGTVRVAVPPAGGVAEPCAAVRAAGCICRYCSSMSLLKMGSSPTTQATSSATLLCATELKAHIATMQTKAKK